MKGIIFITCVLVSAYCVAFGIALFFVADDVSAIYWLEPMCIIASIVYGCIAYKKRPWVISQD